MHQRTNYSSSYHFIYREDRNTDLVSLQRIFFSYPSNQQPWGSVCCSLQHSTSSRARSLLAEMISQQSLCLEPLLQLTRSASLQRAAQIRACSEKYIHMYIYYVLLVKGHLRVTVWRSSRWRKQGAKHMGHIHEASWYSSNSHDADHSGSKKLIKSNHRFSKGENTVIIKLDSFLWQLLFDR